MQQNRLCLEKCPPQLHFVSLMIFQKQKNTNKHPSSPELNLNSQYFVYQIIEKFFENNKDRLKSEIGNFITW